MQLKNDIIEHIKNIIAYKCYGCVTIVDKETVVDSIKTGLIFGKPEFGFLIKYKNFFVY